jgi:hypothetical protein
MRGAVRGMQRMDPERLRAHRERAAAFADALG